jgi:2-dehydro-3-deoxygalactonokinase
MPTGDAASFLWGVVIGSDVRENLPLAPGAVCLVAGAPMVASLFAAAIRQLGGAAELGDGDQLTAAGFLRLAALLRAKGMFA